LAAEVVSSQIRSLLRRQVDLTFSHGVEPVQIIHDLNRLVHTEFQPLGMLLTFLVALVDSEEETITWSGAGHPPAILQCCSAHHMKRLVSQNIILGATEDCILGEGQETLPIHKGDRVIFYTDGIIESSDANGKMLGIEGLQQIIQEHYESPQADLADQVLATARQGSGFTETDDMSLILLDVS